MFVSAATFAAVGGYPDIALMEDIALSKQLRHRGEPAVISEPVTTSSRRWEERGLIRTVLLMWKLRLLFFLGVPSERLLEQYYPELAQSPAARSVSTNTHAQDCYRHPEARILVFAKAPLAGRVKTRLRPRLDNADTLILYQAMLRHVISMVSEARLAPLQLWVDSHPEHSSFREFENLADIRVQHGADLGERMAHAIQHTLQEARVNSVLLIGADCPVMDASYLERALIELQSGAEAVIGPAEDGGYVLLGTRSAMPGLLAGIDWGSDRVLRQTLANLRRSGVPYRLLATLWDVDRPEDLERLNREGLVLDQPGAQAR